MPDYPQSPPPDALALANSEMLMYVAWCQEQIAERAYTAQLPPKPWPGREDLVHACANNFNNPDLILASNAVDQAVTELCKGYADDLFAFTKSTMLLRLKGLRQLIVSGIQNGRKEETFRYVPLMDLPESQRPPQYRGIDNPTLLVKFKLKEKLYSGVDMAAIAQLMNVDRMIAELTGLFGNSQKSLNVMAQFFSGLKDANSGQIVEADPEVGSMALKMKNRTLSGPMNDTERRLLTSIITNTETPTAKPIKKKRGGKVVESEVIEDEEKDEDDEKGEG